MSTVSIEAAKSMNNAILEYAQQRQMGLTIQFVLKLPINNIIMGSLGELADIILAKCVKSKEYPKGHIYDPRSYVVFRIIDGRVLKERQADAYAWSSYKVENAKKVPLGLDSEEGIFNFVELVNTIKSKEEKILFIELVRKYPELYIVPTGEEERRGIFVTQELLDAGISEVPNSYAIDDALRDGTEVELTPIKEGDLLVLEEKSFGTAFYVVGRDEAALTYRRA